MKKIVALLMLIVIAGFAIIPVKVNAGNKSDLNITTKFIENAEVEVNNQGYIKLTKVNELRRDSGLKKEKEAEVIVLVPEKKENIENALEAIKDIKKGKNSSARTRNFMRSINEEGKGVNVCSSGSGTRSGSGWGCKASLKIAYNEVIKNGRKAVLLKKVSAKIKNNQSVSVSDYTINYGCSGTTPKQNYKEQKGSKSYGFVRAASSETKKITCPSTWSYVYGEKFVATVGAHLSVTVKVRNSSNGVSKKKIQISNKLSF